MVKYWKILGDENLNINTAYNISLGCILLIFFLVSYFLGSFLYASEKDELPKPVEKETGFTVAPYNPDKQPDSLQHIPEPKQTEAGSPAVVKRYYDIPLTDEKQDYVFDMCEKYGVSCELVFAIMGAESIYSEVQISKDGDYGIMQINRINHQRLSQELGVSDFLDYKQNVLCGIYMLSDYYNRYTDFNKIAMCYRYGETGAKKMWDQGIYETDYTRQIVRSIAMLKYR